MASPANEAERIVFQQSVQSRAKPQPNGTAPVGGFMPAWSDGGLFFQLGNVIESIPEWSIYPWARDRMLRAFYKKEPIIAGAVYSMQARMKSLSYRLAGDETKHDTTQAVLDNADYGNGLRTLLAKTIIDYCTQDNGAFWELVGNGNPSSELLGGVALGVNYLDPAQCYRTFDPTYPVLYIDPLHGSMHKLHKSRVVEFSSMTQPNELARGVGFSPLSRALLSVQLMQAITRFRYEKASGNFERAIGFGTGMTQIQLRGLLQQAALEDENMGFVRFGKIPFFVSPRKEVHLEILDLASIPDGFDLMTETEVYVYTLALAFGVDAREFWVATQSGATKADASIQNMKSRGKGLADMITTLEDAIQKHLMPENVMFEFDFVDDEHDQETAKSNQVKVNYLTEIKREGGLSETQYQAMLIHEGILPEEVLLDADSMAIIDESEDEIENENPDDVMPFPQANNPNMPDEMQDSEDENQAQKSISSYRRELRSIMRGIIDNQINVPSAIQATDSVVRRSLTQAAYEGIEKGGLRRGDLTQAELLTIQEMIFNEQDYVVGLVEYAKSQSTSDNPAYGAVFNRVDMWANRYDMVVNKFYQMAASDKKTIWRLHGKHKTDESCIDCLAYNGRVYRNSIWEKHDIQTQMWDLSCRGVHCGCGMKETDEPITRGFPPKPKGRVS